MAVPVTSVSLLKVLGEDAQSPRLLSSWPTIAFPRVT